MTPTSSFARLFYAFVLAANIHAANVPPPRHPDPFPSLRPTFIIDPVPTTCTTSTVSIGCGNNACQSAWATAFTSSNAYVQSFCSSFTSPGRKNTLIFDKRGPASACTKGLGNVAIQSSISSVCSCYAGPEVPTQAFITICPTCPPVKTQTVTTSVPTTTTVLRTLDGSVKTVTTIITLVIDPPPPSRITTTTTQTITRSDLSAPCTTTTITTQTAIYDYFTFLTTTYQAGRYPCATTFPSVSTVTFYTPYCNQISEHIIYITSTVTAGLPFPSSLPPATCEPTTTTTVTLAIDPLPIEHTITETAICATPVDASSSTFSPIIIDDGGFTFRETLVAPTTSGRVPIRPIREGEN